MELMQLLILALLIEALWETVKLVYADGVFQVAKVGTLVLAVGISVLTGADLFGQLGIQLPVPYVGSVLTGVLLSRGSNFLHDLLDRINATTNGASGEMDEE